MHVAISFTPTTFYDEDASGHPQPSDPFINAGYFNSRESVIYQIVQALNGLSDADLYNLAQLDANSNGVIASEGSGWVNKTYSQLKTLLSLVKGDVGLGNVDNTSDVNKPVSTAQQTALDGKQTLDSDLTSIAALDSTTSGAIASDGAGWIKKTYTQLKTALSLVKADVGLGNVDNTSDVNKPISTLQQAGLDTKSPIGWPQYASSEKLIFVSKSGSDSNDGLAPGKAKLTIASAISSVTSGGLIQIGSGTWSESGLTPSNGTIIKGISRTTTILNLTSDAVLLNLLSSQNVIIEDIGLTMATTAPNGTLIKFDGAFQCHLKRVKLSGQHADKTVSTYQGQRGIWWTGNSGDNTVTDFLMHNLGIGTFTDTAINWFVGGKFTNCWKGATGGDSTGVAFQAGYGFESVTWTGNGTAVSHHVQIGGTAGPWAFNKVWFERANIALEIGLTSTTYGPVAFSMSNVTQLSAATNCLLLNAARQTYLASLRFNADPEGTPTELVVNANATDGIAQNLVSKAGFDIARTTFPGTWTYFPRYTADAQLAGVNAYLGGHVTSGNPSYYHSGSGRARVGYDGSRTVLTDAGGGRDVGIISGSTPRQLLTAGSDGNAYVGTKTVGTSDAGGAVGGLFLRNAVTLPTSNPSTGGILYVNNGALTYRGSSGTITVLGPA